ncbi:MAG: hypothetical protein ACP5DX_17835 [Paracoccaceae bacterium]|jgi:hypothetical protein
MERGDGTEIDAYRRALEADVKRLKKTTLGRISPAQSEFLERMATAELRRCAAVSPRAAEGLGQPICRLTLTSLRWNIAYAFWSQNDELIASFKKAYEGLDLRLPAWMDTIGGVQF